MRITPIESTSPVFTRPASPPASPQYGHFYIIDDEPVTKYEIPEYYLEDNVKYYKTNYDKITSQIRKRRFHRQRHRQQPHIDDDFIRDEVIQKESSIHWYNYFFNFLHIFRSTKI
jgi:hypothetical protein